ncbi:AN1-type zinc finger protein [Klosneuvirus KNV1]|uniref:AN1-type zinc finger protein n=1 Tax=Klosneuvirus KNV1 TaxID=1977640 RepID=A0A1V0SI40_9VIRU|nr:AN1-type zinc finger protein [Klosneuvirus KNV1]
MTDQAEIINYIKKNSIDIKSNTFTINEIHETKTETVALPQQTQSKNINRCQLSDCNKKLSLTETLGKCKCGNIYCSSHKHSTHHKCTYDYKKDNNHNIYKAEPSKLNRI